MSSRSFSCTAALPHPVRKGSAFPELAKKRERGEAQPRRGINKRVSPVRHSLTASDAASREELLRLLLLSQQGAI